MSRPQSPAALLHTVVVVEEEASQAARVALAVVARVESGTSQRSMIRQLLVPMVLRVSVVVAAAGQEQVVRPISRVEMAALASS